jgi:hypothetical protein
MERNNKRECDKGDIKHFALGQESLRSWARNALTVVACLLLVRLGTLRPLCRGRLALHLSLRIL